ncbi:MAG: hypothetical protein ACM3PS_02100 [Syntrophothermus sp.]
MPSDAVLFAGISFVAGRKPILFAAVDDGLEIVALTQWDIPSLMNCLVEYEGVQLTIDIPSSKTGQGLFQQVQEKISGAGFRHYSQPEGPRLWIGSNAEGCFGVFQPELFPRRTLEGRLQRALILYDEGLQIPDPMDFFEEITRHKLLQGVLPAENIYAPKQLDALILAYVSWMAGNPSEKVIIRDQIMLPRITETD